MYKEKDQPHLIPSSTPLQVSWCIIKAGSTPPGCLQVLGTMHLDGKIGVSQGVLYKKWSLSDFPNTWQSVDLYHWVCSLEQPGPPRTHWTQSFHLCSEEYVRLARISIMSPVPFFFLLPPPFASSLSGNVCPGWSLQMWTRRELVLLFMMSTTVSFTGSLFFSSQPVTL